MKNLKLLLLFIFTKFFNSSSILKTDLKNRYFNPIILSKSEFYKSDKIFKDQILIFGKSINFIKLENSIYSPVNKDPKNIQNLINKRILNKIGYEEFEKNDFVLKLKYRSRCKFNNFLDMEKQDHSLLSKNILVSDVQVLKNVENINFFKEKRDFLIIYLNKTNWRFFQNFRNLLINNLYLSEKENKLFLDHYCFKKFESALNFDKKMIPEKKMTKLKIKLFYDITNLKITQLQDLPNNILPKLNCTQFSILIKNIFDFYFLLTSQNYKTNFNPFITANLKVFFPFIYKLNSFKININFLAKNIIFLLEKKFGISFSVFQVNFLTNYFIDMYNIFKIEKLNLNYIVIFLNFRNYVKELFSGKNNNDVWEYFFVNEVKISGEDYYFDSRSTDIENDSLLNAFPNDYFDTEENLSNCFLCLKIVFVWFLSWVIF